MLDMTGGLWSRDERKNNSFRKLALLKEYPIRTQLIPKLKYFNHFGELSNVISLIYQSIQRFSRKGYPVK